MICPKCKCEMRIAATRIEVTGDNSPDTTTKVMTVQDLSCRSPKCDNFNRIVTSVKTELKVTEGGEPNETGV